MNDQLTGGTSELPSFILPFISFSTNSDVRDTLVDFVPSQRLSYVSGVQRERET